MKAFDFIKRPMKHWKDKIVGWHAWTIKVDCPHCERKDAVIKISGTAMDAKMFVARAERCDRCERKLGKEEAKAQKEAK